MSEKTDKKQSPKSTQAEMEIRITDVLDLIMNGRPRSYIIQHASKAWGIGDRATDDLIARAKVTLKEINAGTRAESQELVLSNLWNIYRLAMKTVNEEGEKIKPDPYLALNVLKEIAKVKGLNEEHVVHTIDDKRDGKDLSEKELEQELERQLQ